MQVITVTNFSPRSKRSRVHTSIILPLMMLLPILDCAFSVELQALNIDQIIGAVGSIASQDGWKLVELNCFAVLVQL